MIKHLRTLALFLFLIIGGFTPCTYAQTYSTKQFLAYAGIYNSAITYSPSDVVSEGSLFYRSKVASNLANDPISSPTQWEVMGGGFAPATYNADLPGGFSFPDQAQVSSSDPTFNPSITFGGNNQYLNFNLYFTQHILPNDSGAVQVGSTAVSSQYQGMFPGYSKGEGYVYGFGSYTMNQYDYTDGIRYGLLINGRQHGGDDTNWIDVQVNEANVDIFGDDQGSSINQYSRTEASYNATAWTNTIATGGGGLGAKLLTFTTSGCCGYNSFGPHMPLVDKTPANVVTTTLSGYADFGINSNTQTVGSYVSSTPLTASVEGSMASAVVVNRITNNTTGALSQAVVNFDMLIATPPDVNTLCTILGPEGGMVDWFKPLSTPTLVSTGRYNMSADLHYDHTIGTTTFCGGTMGFLEEADYTFSYDGTAQYLFEIYGTKVVSGVSTIIFGIQIPSGPSRPQTAQVDGLTGKIYQGFEITGSLNTTNGQPDGEQLQGFDNNAVFAAGDVVQVDSYMSATYGTTFAVDNILNPWAFWYGTEDIFHGPGGIFNPASRYMHITNDVPDGFLKAFGGQGYAKTNTLFEGDWANGIAYAKWPVKDDGSAIPNSNGVPRGGLIGVGIFPLTGTVHGTGDIWDLPGGSLTYTSRMTYPNSEYDFTGQGVGVAQLDVNLIRVPGGHLGGAGKCYFGGLNVSPFQASAFGETVDAGDGNVSADCQIGLGSLNVTGTSGIQFGTISPSTLLGQASMTFDGSYFNFTSPSGVKVNGTALSPGTGTSAGTAGQWQMAGSSGTFAVAPATTSGTTTTTTGLYKFTNTGHTAMCVGSGTCIDLSSDAYISSIGNTGNPTAGSLLSRFDTTGFASVDLITGGNTYTGWSVQMQPTLTGLYFLDRAAGGGAGVNALSITQGTEAAAFAGPVTAPGYTETLFTPSSSSATCTTGQFADDANYHYVCTATNTWKRAALSTF